MLFAFLLVFVPFSSCTSSGSGDLSSSEPTATFPPGSSSNSSSNSNASSNSGSGWSEPVSVFEPSSFGEVVTYDWVQNINPSGVPFVFPTFNSTTVTLSYAQSTNYTLTVSSIDLNHYETSSPLGITFVCTGIATYQLHFQILYGIVVNQSITLNVISGNGQTFSIPIACNNQGFTLDVIISSSVMPNYPTPEEVWTFGAGEVAEMVANTSRNYENQLMWADIRLNVTLGGVVVSIACIAIMFAHLLREKVRLTRLETYGYGYREGER